MKSDDAQRFVQRMRDNSGFRQTVTGFNVSSDLWDFLKCSGFDFDPCDLVKAMAACMADLEETAVVGSD